MLLIHTTILVIVLIIRHIHSQPCVNSCNSHGRCSDTGRECECFDGYTGADCSLLICPYSSAWSDQSIGTDDSHNSAECSNMGICDRASGVCSCRLGFEGNACERKTCPNSCGGVGKCQSMYYYAQTVDPGLRTVYAYDSIWDANKMYGCNCNQGYSGYDCSLRVCPVGDDPLTGNSAGTATNPIQFNEIQKIVCSAQGGSFTLTFGGYTTAYISFKASTAQVKAAIEALPSIGSGTIVFTSTASQACSQNGNSMTIEFLQLFGPRALFVSDITSGDLTNTGGKVPSVLVSKTRTGTKESESCSNRGLCDTSNGICECSSNYDSSDGLAAIGLRGDCGYATQTIQYCPGTVSCSAHGVCAGNPTYRCSCSTGWTGADCSERVCPKDVSWFSYPSADNTAHMTTLVECSDMGTCDRVGGTCTCEVGFVGTACQYLTCPGDTDLCSLHGQCLDMNTLAARSKTNGVSAGLYSYGDTPNDPNTWDARKIFGCLCDDGYTGYDCSLYTCATGDDPNTLSQTDEQQYVTCTDDMGSSGSISFVYKDEPTAVLSPSATTAQVKAALEALESIGTVSVETILDGAPDTICSVTGNTLLITFMTEHGDIPDLLIVQQNIQSITVLEVRKGTKEEVECNGRGLCDRTNGICECFPGYGSSDGMGGAGSRGECGYIEPILPLIV